MTTATAPPVAYGSSSSAKPRDEKQLTKSGHADSDIFAFLSSRLLTDNNDLEWLSSSRAKSWECFEAVIDDNPDVMTLQFGLNLASNQQQGQFRPNPLAFLVEK